MNTPLESQSKTMHTFHKAIATLGLATALGGLNLIFHTTPAVSQEEHHSSPSQEEHHSSPSNTNRHDNEPSPRTRTEEKTEIIEEGIEHFEVPTLTNEERAVEQVLNQGLEKLNSKNYEGALKDFNKVLEIDPEHERAYRLRGDLLRQMKKYKGAVRDYTQAIKQNPEFSSTYISRGETYEIVGNYMQAIEDYNKAIELYPEDGIGYSHRGGVYSRLGHNEKAMDDLNKAIDFNPARAEAYLNRGNLQAKLGHIKRYSEESEEAAILYRKAVADYQQAAKLFADQGYIADSQRAMNTMQKLKQQVFPTQATR